MKKAIKLTADGEVTSIVLENSANWFDVITDAVGGGFEVYPIPGGVEMWANDEAKLIGLDFNHTATSMFRVAFKPTDDYILGNVLFTGPPDEEGETQGLRDFAHDSLMVLLPLLVPVAQQHQTIHPTV